MFVVEGHRRRFSVFGRQNDSMLVKLEAYNDGDFWCARGVGEDILTQGKTVDELFSNIREAATLHFENRVPATALDILVVSELKSFHATAET